MEDSGKLMLRLNGAAAQGPHQGDKFRARPPAPIAPICRYVPAMVTPRLPPDHAVQDLSP